MAGNIWYLTLGYAKFELNYSTSYNKMIAVISAIQSGMIKNGSKWLVCEDVKVIMHQQTCMRNHYSI